MQPCMAAVGCALMPHAHAPTPCALQLPKCEPSERGMPHTYQCREGGQDVCSCPQGMSCRALKGEPLQLGDDQETFCVVMTLQMDAATHEPECV